MTDDDGQFVNIYIDVDRGAPDTERTRAEISNRFHRRLDGRLPGAVRRARRLPSLLLQHPDKEFVKLLLEARELFELGYFYGCVAMCGIVGERLIKDTLRRSLMVRGAEGIAQPTEDAFEQLERVDTRSLTAFLLKTGAIDSDTSAAARRLADLRNDYAHARGKAPEQDAEKAIRELHTVVYGTVSVFQDFEIREGRLVARQRGTPPIGPDAP